MYLGDYVQLFKSINETRVKHKNESVVNCKYLFEYSLPALMKNIEGKVDLVKNLSLYVRFVNIVIFYY